MRICFSIVIAVGLAGVANAQQFATISGSYWGGQHGWASDIGPYNEGYNGYGGCELMNIHSSGVVFS